MAELVASLEQEADRAAAAGDVEKAVRLLDQAAQAADQPVLWIKLSAMRRATGDSVGALAAIDHALGLAPLDLAALLARAFLLERMRDPRAGEAFSVAAAQSPDAGAVPAGLAAALEHAVRKSEQHRLDTEQRLLHLLPPELAPGPRTRLARFASNSSRRTRHYHQEPTHFHFPGLPEIEFHDPALFAGIDVLEASTDVIRSEFEALMAAEAAEMVPYIQYPSQVPLRQWKELNHSRKWSAMHLLQNGCRVDVNALHCPQTLAIVGALSQPQVAGASPNAMFSLLAPHTRIPPHTGVANTRLVCHLPLIVPADCGFRVGATTRHWQVGQAFVFDDTIEHEAWNDSDELRVVLIVDLWPPELSEEERRVVASMLPAIGVGFSGGI